MKTLVILAMKTVKITNKITGKIPKPWIQKIKTAKGNKSLIGNKVGRPIMISMFPLS